MNIRVALTAYAKAMILLTICGGAVLYWQGDRTGKEAASRTSELVQAQSREQASQLEFRQLESEQQAGRATYSPQQTVEMSYKVQEAKDEYETAMAQVSRLEPEVQQLDAQTERTFLWLIPLIAVGLLHIVLAMMFRPQRDERAAETERRNKSRI
jgi:hypothetical protein